MVDIGLELQAQIKKEFEEAISQNTQAINIYMRIERDKATQKDIVCLAQIAGETASKILIRVMSNVKLPNDRMYWNIAEKAIRPIMEDIHNLINNAAIKVVTAERRENKISIKPIKSNFPEERISSLINNFVEAYNAEVNDEERSMGERT